MHVRWVSAARAFIPLIGLLPVLAGCDPAHDVIVDNRGKEPVMLWEDGVPSHLVRPDNAVTFNVIFFKGPRTYEVREFCGEAAFCEQRVLERVTFTWAELEEQGTIRIMVGNDSTPGAH